MFRKFSFYKFADIFRFFGEFLKQKISEQWRIQYVNEHFVILFLMTNCWFTCCILQCLEFFHIFHVAETHVGAPDKGAPKIPNAEEYSMQINNVIKNNITRCLIYVLILYSSAVRNFSLIQIRRWFRFFSEFVKQTISKPWRIQ